MPFFFEIQHYQRNFIGPVNAASFRGKLVHIALSALVATFGKEREGGFWGGFFRRQKHPTYTNTHFHRIFENGSQLSDFAWWKCINPLKWVEFVACFVWSSLNEISLLGEDDGDLQQARLRWTAYARGSFWENHKDKFAICFRALVFYPAGLAYGVLRWFTSPFNQVFRPLWQSLKTLWRDLDTGELEVGGYPVGRIRAILLGLIVLAVVAFIVASIATGGTLPFLGALAALIYSAVPPIATFLGGSVFVSTLSACFIGFAASIASVACIQRFFSGIIPTVADIALAANGEGGYSRQQAIISFMTRNKEEQIEEYGSTWIGIEFLQDGIFRRSTATAMKLFNREMQAPAEVKLASSAGSALGTRRNALLNSKNNFFRNILPPHLTRLVDPPAPNEETKLMETSPMITQDDIKLPMMNLEVNFGSSYGLRLTPYPAGQ